MFRPAYSQGEAKGCHRFHLRNLYFSENKSPSGKHRAGIYVWSEKLLLGGSADGAGASAGAAADAGIRIDDELAIALGDGADRTLGCASAAADAIIGNLVCH